MKRCRESVKMPSGFDDDGMYIIPLLHCVGNSLELSLISFYYNSIKVINEHIPEQLIHKSIWSIPYTTKELFTKAMQGGAQATIRFTYIPGLQSRLCVCNCHWHILVQCHHFETGLDCRCWTPRTSSQDLPRKSEWVSVGTKLRSEIIISTWMISE